MDPHCLKCNDQFTESDTSYICATTCGHLFHCQCLMQWLESSQTCPHCTQKQTNQEVFKIYFSLAERPKEDTSALKNKLDSLINELQLKDDELKCLKEEINEVKASKKELRQELSKLRKQVEVTKGAIRFKQMSIDYHTRICRVKEKYETEADQLRQHLSTLESMNEILNRPDGDIDDILSQSTLDYSGLIVCVDTLAENVIAADRQKEKLEDDLMCCQNDVSHIEEVLATLMEERSILMQRLQEDEDSGELLDIKRNIFSMIQNCRLEDLFNIFPELEFSNQSKQTEQAIPETISPGTTSSETSQETTSQEICEQKYSPPSPDLALQKKCKDLVKNACRNPMGYLTSGRVELFDSDEDSEAAVEVKTEKRNAGVCVSNRLNNKLDHKKYKKLVKKTNLSAAAGLPKKPKPPELKKKLKSRDSDTYFLELMASVHKRM